MRKLHYKNLLIFFGIMCIVVILNHKLEIKENNQDVTKESDFKYILQWTLPTRSPFLRMGKGREGFIKRKCPHTNCIVTSNRSYFDKNSKFDAIVFAGPEIVYCYDLPTQRSPHQKFIFASVESAHNYPVCSNRFDGFFNWTWTYKLDSELRWTYMVTRDINNTIVGPNKDIRWMKLEDMNPISDKLKEQLSKKQKAAAWLVSNCFSRSKRERFVESLQNELNKYDLDIDIFGRCYDLKCSEYDVQECYKLIKDVYHFYLAFENGFSEDYVTEKLLTALANDAVPIVYGGANYTRFMPDGMYLNARELGVHKLAAKMNESISEPKKYYEYFKWKNHYSYHEVDSSVETDPYCLLCSMLNDHNMINNITVYEHFHEWWDPPDLCY